MSQFIIKIDDGYCEWEYGFSPSSSTCITDFINVIEQKMEIKSDYQKLTKAFKIEL